MLKKLLQACVRRLAAKPCPSCLAKDQHIADLRSLTIPAHTAQGRFPLIELEADMVMSGSQNVIHIDEVTDTEPTEVDVDEDIASERDRLLSGNY